MFGMLPIFKNTAALQRLEAVVAAIGRSQAVIEFTLDGTILHANQNFLETVGYTLSEVQGRHHSLFVDPAERNSKSYADFWTSLAQGEFKAAEFRRITKGGREIWLQATYNPILDASGRPFKVIKFASDVTDAKVQNADHLGQIEAIRRSEAVIEFALDGTILSANSNFLAAMGYELDEIRGRHHRMFVDEPLRDSAEYREFWAALARGEFRSGEYKRRRRNGSEIWLQASYNPILDPNGRPVKVVKFASDVTHAKREGADHLGQIEAIRRSQAVIEFDLDGTILTANENFLQTMGYTLAEIEGRHHAMFVLPEERDGPEYRAFWERLGRGEYFASEFRRVTKSGREVWLRATYNPILDPEGRPFKVVKFASDITGQALARSSFGDTFDSISSGAQRLNSSVHEIANTMAQSRDIASDASRRVLEADESAKRLSDAARDMGRIVNLINQITGQINLLALNATIESARAGEAGRGFAVVASEVKQLARQAESATQEIAQEITGIQATSQDVVRALQTIRSAIDAVNGHVDATASSVDQQNTLTHTMTESMQQAMREAARLWAA